MSWKFMIFYMIFFASVAMDVCFEGEIPADFQTADGFARFLINTPRTKVLSRSRRYTNAAFFLFHCGEL